MTKVELRCRDDVQGLLAVVEMSPFSDEGVGMVTYFRKDDYITAWNFIRTDFYPTLVEAEQAAAEATNLPSMSQ